MVLPLTRATLRKSLKIIIRITNIEYIHVPDNMHFLIYKMRALLKGFGLLGCFFFQIVIVWLISIILCLTADLSNSMHLH